MSDYGRVIIYRSTGDFNTEIIGIETDNITITQHSCAFNARVIYLSTIRRPQVFDAYS
jgi:hypothetical protein